MIAEGELLRGYRPQYKVYIVRYADDFICTFELERDAKRFQEVLAKRLGRYSLELAEDTRGNS